MHSLQTSVQAVLLGGIYDVDWLLKGVPSKSLVDTWPPLTADKAGPAGSITSDGRFLYLHGPFGLQKVGSGFGNTIKVSELLGSLSAEKYLFSISKSVPPVLQISLLRISSNSLSIPTSSSYCSHIHVHVHQMAYRVICASMHFT